MNLSVPCACKGMARSRRQGRVLRSYASRRTSTLTALASPGWNGAYEGTLGVCMSSSGIGLQYD